MARQTSVHPKQVRPEETRRQEAEEIAGRDAETAEAQASVVDQADDFLDEIDAALAENIECALEFWSSYQQKGGQ